MTIDQKLNKLAKLSRFPFLPYCYYLGADEAGALRFRLSCKYCGKVCESTKPRKCTKAWKQLWTCPEEAAFCARDAIKKAGALIEWKLELFNLLSDAARPSSYDYEIAHTTPAQWIEAAIILLERLQEKGSEIKGA